MAGGVRRRRDLIGANAAALVLLAIVLAIGWREAAAFGLVVLLVMDGVVLFRERAAGSHRGGQE